MAAAEISGKLFDVEGVWEYFLQVFSIDEVHRHSFWILLDVTVEWAGSEKMVFILNDRVIERKFVEKVHLILWAAMRTGSVGDIQL